jgi:prevent-host-death family protein
MERIGVRELRQQASRYLARVQAGETFEITDNGKPVAQLVPVLQTTLDALYASGYIKPAAQPGGGWTVPPAAHDFDAMAELDATREDRF